MARGTQHRKRRPTANARVAPAAAAKAAKRPARPAWEEQLFFGRLRTHAKWMFVFLAVVFGLSFVILGVGSGSTGISQVLQNFFSGSSASGPSLSSLQKKTVAKPEGRGRVARVREQAAAERPAGRCSHRAHDLHEAEAEGPERAAPAGRHLPAAGAGLGQPLRARAGQTPRRSRPPRSSQPKTSSKLGKALATLTNPIATAVSSQTSSQTSNDYTQVITYLSEREQAYEKLAKLAPNDATTQYSLAQAAQDASDTKTAIKGYKAFLKLAPSDSQAPAARAAIKQLKAQAGRQLELGDDRRMTAPRRCGSRGVRQSARLDSRA